MNQTTVKTPKNTSHKFPLANKKIYREKKTLGLRDGTEMCIFTNRNESLGELKNRRAARAIGLV